MGVNTQTRYNHQYTVAMTSVQTTMQVDVSPAFLSGYLTIRLGYTDQEDVKFTNVVGLQLQGLLRGLSSTALTDTEVLGLKQPHSLNSPATLNTIKGTTLHYIINDKASITSAETITGLWTYGTNPIMSGISDTNGLKILEFIPQATAVNWLRVQNAATAQLVRLVATGADADVSMILETKGSGIIYLEDGAQMSSAAFPTVPAGIANKAYVDFTATGVPITTLTTKGDIITATAPSTAVRKGVGIDGTILGADSSTSDGLLYINSNLFATTLPSAGGAFSYSMLPSSNNGWTIAGETVFINGTKSTQAANCRIYGTPLGGANGGTMAFSDGIDLRLQYCYIPSAISAGVSGSGSRKGYFHGFSDSNAHTVANLTDITNVGELRIGFTHYNGRIYAVTCDGAAITTTNIQADGIIKQLYLIVYTPSSVKFYINAVLVATHTTHIPVGGSILFDYTGYSASGATVIEWVSTINVTETIA